MTLEETTKAKCLIAEFMGLIKTEKDWGEPTYKLDIKGRIETDLERGVIWVSQLKYDSSFDALMPVVKKISKLKIDDFSKKKPVMASLIDVDISSIFTAAVDFIIWFNTENLKKV